ncbi:MAG: lytic transglycosylase domain-containing protein [Syntrophorhabdaceae bacterium]|nr:lytic transglycosylase domain-containing protein [Syntrophorhabdales bacterium]MBP9561060.1 lytic transglycosylase domain-containing protein [Syntrophorhabdaceae bacterium]
MKTKQKIILTSIGAGALLFVYLYGGLNKDYPIFQREHIKQGRIEKEIVAFLKDEKVNIPEERLLSIARMVYRTSKNHNLDYRLMLAIMKVESNFRHDAISPKGARGLFQVKPSLARYIADDAGVHWSGNNTLDEPEKNIKIGVYFFSQLLKDFESLNLALHAYNMGPTKLKKILTENTSYSKKFSNLVIKEYKRISSILPSS